jgi:hypothetical protein
MANPHRFRHRHRGLAGKSRCGVASGSSKGPVRAALTPTSTAPICSGSAGFSSAAFRAKFLVAVRKIAVAGEGARAMLLPLVT